MKTSKPFRIFLFLTLTLALTLAAGCGKRNDTSGAAASASSPATGKHPVATIETSNGKTITLELYPEVAPNTVNNFLSLAKKGYYNGTIFHRVMPGFMIQGGDPEGTGMGGPGYTIKGEFTNNGFQNDLKHTRGVLSMARKGDPEMDSAGSQFFIMVADSSQLDGAYAAFGKVTAGMDTVDEIVNQKIDPNDPQGTKPADPISIKQITVDTQGVAYKEPEKMQ
jgi:peptidyl-prolyl cis-trans isomerase B (cyclophilin B)